MPLIQVAGWAIGLLLAAMAAWRLSRIVLARKHPSTGRRMWQDSMVAPNWYALALWSALAAGWFTLLGVFPPARGGLIAGLCAVVAAAGFRVWTEEGRLALRDHLAHGLGDAWRDVPRRGGTGRAGPAETVVAEAVAARGVPPVMEDPAIGPPPEPGEVAAAGVPVPPPYAALAAFIRDFEPADDMELRMWMDGHAAGQVAVADAWHDQGGALLDGAGLDPAYIAGFFEVGNGAAEHASLIAQVHKRFGVIYGAIKEWLSGGRMLPHNARDFLTEE